MQLRDVLKGIVSDPERHAKWLNTLSYLENCGARKIARCEHPTMVQEEMLKHASEEFRHALHLKRQIYRLGLRPPLDYSLEYVLGGRTTWRYLDKLELNICRYLKTDVYVLVTYAIEMRAAELYRIYDEVLHSVNSKVSVKSILLEEGEHLQEMQEQLHAMPGGKVHAAAVCTIESKLYEVWLQALVEDVTWSRI